MIHNMVDNSAGSGTARRRRSELAGRYQSDGMAGSSPQKLLLAVFDRLVQDLQRAAVALGAGQIEESHQALVNAQELVYELNLALAPEVWPAAADLRAVYEHVMGLLIEANLNKTVAPVEQCLRIVGPLAETWHEAHRALQAQQGAPTSGGVADGTSSGVPGGVSSR